MYTLILIIHVFLALILIFVILLQQRHGGLSSTFGGQSIFGGRGAAPFLTKTTVVLLAIFFLTAFSLAYMAKSQIKAEQLMKSKSVSEQPYRE